jgi:cytochrome c peroxidase
MASAKWVLVLAIAGLQPACTPEEAVTPPPRNSLVQMGEALFKDVRLGADGRTSCATCHISAHAFSDAHAVSIGAFGREGTRNSPSLIGLLEQGPQFWDGREETLAQAVLQPLGNPREMGHDSVTAAVQHIAALPEYRRFFGPQISEADLSEALSSYLLQLDPGPSPYDRARAAGDMALLGAQAQRGLQLFQGKAQCASCHLTEAESAFSDGRHHHASVGFERIAGNIRSLQSRLEQTRAAGEPLGKVILADTEIAELGRFAVTSDPQDMGAFRTPSLRNVARTAPYMHDGSIQTLDAAIEHELYYRGLASGQPISLTVEERRELLAFLEALSTP